MSFFKKSPLETWWDKLPESHKTYLSNQPVWHDDDLYRSMIFGIVAGFVFGIFVGAMLWVN